MDVWKQNEHKTIWKKNKLKTRPGLMSYKNSTCCDKRESDLCLCAVTFWMKTLLNDLGCTANCVKVCNIIIITIM